MVDILKHTLTHRGRFLGSRYVVLCEVYEDDCEGQVCDQIGTNNYHGHMQRPRPPGN